MQAWGYHLLINARRCAPLPIRSKPVIETFARKLVKNIDMVPYGEPQVIMFGSGNKQGYTLVQLIETSNITGHFVEETNDMYLDVFSCKEFEPETVKDMVETYFKPQTINSRMILRDASREMIDLHTGSSKGAIRGHPTHA
jgi:S-adenosylmethionine/arginine decarboxylase-like enzyme